jgi:molybdate transport system regulatory protein
VAKLSIRFRVDLTSCCAIGPGKVALLELIGSRGSLSQAARDLDMSYRRAWLLLASINAGFREPVVTLATGGKGGGGAQLTAFGTSLIEVYRTFEAEIASRAEDAFSAVARRACSDAESARGPRRPLKRRRATRSRPAPVRGA